MLMKNTWRVNGYIVLLLNQKRIEHLSIIASMRFQ